MLRDPGNSGLITAAEDPVDLAVTIILPPGRPPFAHFVILHEQPIMTAMLLTETRRELPSGIYLPITGQRKPSGIAPELILLKEMYHEILFTGETVPFAIIIVIVIPAIETAATDTVIIMAIFTGDALFLCMGHVTE